MSRLISVRARAAVTVLAVLAGLSTVVLATPPTQADTQPDPGTPATVSADALPTWQINGVVWSQATVGNTVYVAGRFTRARPSGVAAGGAGEVTANNIFAYDIRTGERVASFNHQLNAQAMSVAKSPDGSRVYFGGDFTTVDGIARGHVAAFDTATGNLVSTFAPNVGGQVRAMAATNTELFVGGAFTVASGQSRIRLASFASSNGAISAWAPKADDESVWSMTLAPDNSRVIVGGAFTTLNGAAAYGMGSLSTTTGAQMPWAANQLIRVATSTGAITSLRADGTQIYGTAYAYGGPTNFEGTFAADPYTGVVAWSNDCHGDNYDVLPIGQVVYNVSHSHDCSWIGEFGETNPRTFHFASASTTYATGTNTGPDNYGWNFNGRPSAKHLHWWPTLAMGSFTGQYQAGWSLTGNSDYIAIGGEFPSANSKAQQGLVRFARPGLAPNKRGMENASFNVQASSVSSGVARVSWLSQWDMDNQNIRYDVYRDGGATPVYTVTAKSTFWARPTLGFADKNLVPGSTHTYTVKASDPYNNSATSPVSAPVTISSVALSTYGNDVINDGASAYWRLNEASGTAVRDLIGFNDATALSGLTRNQAGAIAGDSNTATTFSGTSTGTAGTNATVPTPTSFSAEAWVKTTTTRGGKVIGYGSSQTGSSSSYDRHIYMDNAGHFAFGVYNGTTSTLISPLTYRNGQWHHVVGTMDAGGMNLYVDGKRVGANPAVTSGQAYNGYWRIGGDNLNSWPNRPTSNFLAGTIDEVAVYPNALPLSAVAKHYNDGGGSVANLPPSAVFTSTVDGLTASFDGSGSSDPDGTIASYAWNFGDGTTGTTATPDHAYADPGTYTVSLTVTDNAGATGTFSNSVTVTTPPPNQAPTAAFTFNTSGLSASFDASGSSDPDGTVASYAWNFGDGSTGTTATPNHTYADTGTYNVELTVTDNDGDTGTITKPVSVTAPSSLVLASDDFSRTSAAGWGSADVGGAWSVNGTLSNATVGAGLGVLRMASAGSGPSVYLSSLSSNDTDVLVSFSLDKLPVGGTSGVDQGIVARRIVGSGDYRAKVRVLPSGVVRLGVYTTNSAGAQTAIVSEANVAGITYTAGMVLDVRVEAIGTSPTTVRAKLWQHGDPEPGAWMASGTDSSAALQAAGTAGVHSFLAGTVTNAPILAQFDTFRVFKASTLP